jgi:phosphoglycolate phosphatase
MRAPRARLARPTVSPFPLVVFDLDGTLVDSTEDLRTAMNAVVAELRPEAPPLSYDQVRGFVGEGAAHLVSRSLAASGIDPPPLDVLPRFLAVYRSHLLETTYLYPGVAEALDGLGRSALAVLTNKPGDLAREILKALGILDRFFRVVGGGDVSARKPDPGGLLDLLGEVHARPGETLMVGDSAIDVRTGRAASTFTAGVLYGLDPAGVRAEKPDFLVAEAREIPNLGPSTRP